MTEMYSTVHAPRRGSHAARRIAAPRWQCLVDARVWFHHIAYVYLFNKLFDGEGEQVLHLEGALSALPRGGPRQGMCVSARVTRVPGKLVTHVMRQLASQINAQTRIISDSASPRGKYTLPLSHLGL